MSADAERQTRLFGDLGDESVHIETSGRVIRPALAPVATLVDEAKLRFREDGLHITAVDAANVAMVALTVHESAFDAYDLRGGDDLLVGVNLDRLTGRLSDTRLGKQTDDPVVLDIDGDRTLVEVERGYDTHSVTYAHEVLNVDPNSIRAEPDLPDLTNAYTADVDARAFCDAVGHVTGPHDHAAFRVVDGAFRLTGRVTDEDSPLKTAADFGERVTVDDDAVRADNGVALYSGGYLDDLVAGIEQSKVATVTARWNRAYPLRLSAVRELDDEVAVEFDLWVAPRRTVGGPA